MKKVLILGAGLMQKPAILAAKSLGLESVVADGNPNAPCAALADRFESIDLKDRESLLNLARSIGTELAGVFTAGTDFSASVAYVAEKIGLPSHSFQSCLNASDKVRMRGCFERFGVPSPRFQEVSRGKIPELSSKLTEMDFPKVVKPCDNMGGRGCRLVRSKEEFLPAVENSVSNSRTSRAIFEDYMEGPEFSIDSVVYNGTLTITGFADRHIFYPPYFIEMGHTISTNVEQKIKNELIATFALGIKALGLSCGVAKADIKYTKKGPMIGEIAARLSGGYMSGWTFPYASGMNLTEEAMKIAVGREPDYLLANRRPLPWEPHESVLGAEQPFQIYEIKNQLFSAERAWLSIPGKISRICGFEDARGIYGVRDILPRAAEGDSVDFPRNNVEKCGNVIAVALNYDSAVKSAEDAVSAITLRLEPNDERTRKFLEGASDGDEKGFPPSAFTLPPSSGALSRFASRDIPENSKTALSIPEALEPLADSLRDWNHCTLRRTLEKFDSLCPSHGVLNGQRFWTTVLRGGIQGILYALDSGML